MSEITIATEWEKMGGHKIRRLIVAEKELLATGMPFPKATMSKIEREIDSLFVK